MQILYAIAVLSCCVVVWAAYSISLHIRRAHRGQAIHPATLSEALFDAVQQPLPQSRGLKPHPREDLARGMLPNFARKQNLEQHEQRPVSAAFSSKISFAADAIYGASTQRRADLAYFREGFGDISDPDTTRIIGVRPATVRTRN
jgi:hypothetical protein